ncbi:MAG: ParB N-terminal domain-containing protein [Planctomycetota bacterium]
MTVQDRVKELRRVRAGDLTTHPENWRTHPKHQRRAMRAVLSEVGYADALVARELPDGRLQLVDGHLRAETTPDATVPVLVVDLDDAEAAKVLLTHDPIAAMAGADAERVSSLMAKTESDSKPLHELLDRLLAKCQAPMDASDRPEIELPESYQVVVECKDETDQEAIFTRMREEGYRCRVLTL